MKTPLPWPMQIHVPVRKRVQCRTRDLHQSLLVKLNRAQLQQPAQPATPISNPQPVHIDSVQYEVLSWLCVWHFDGSYASVLVFCLGSRVPGYLCKEAYNCRRCNFTRPGFTQGDLHILNALPPKSMTSPRIGMDITRPAVMTAGLKKVLSGFKEKLSSLPSTPAALDRNGQGDAEEQHPVVRGPLLRKNPRL